MLPCAKGSRRIGYLERLTMFRNENEGLSLKLEIKIASKIKVNIKKGGVFTGPCQMSRVVTGHVTGGA